MVGIDLTPTPGLRRPLNFFGLLTDSEKSKLQGLMRQAESTSDYQLMFGHYPTSTVVDAEESYRDRAIPSRQSGEIVTTLK